MNDNRVGGMLLVAGSVAAMITMGLHPVAPHGGGGPMSPHQMATLTLLNRVIHGLGIASLPMMFLGALALTRRLSSGNTDRLPLAALVVYGFAAVAIMAAASMSGFVGSDLMSRMVASDPQLESRRMLLDYTFRINQAFAAVFTVGSCAAIFLWSLAMVRTRQLGVGLGVYGIAAGGLIVVALFCGFLALDVHGFGFVVLAQSIWFVIAGCLLMRSSRETHQPIVIG